MNRRRGLMSDSVTAEGTDLEGFVMNKAWSGNGGNLSNATDYCVSRVFGPMSGDTEICFGHRSGSYGARVQDSSVFNEGSSNNFKASGADTNNIRTLTPTQYGNKVYISVTFLIENIDTCYIKKVTTGEYYWKGKNVT